MDLLVKSRRRNIVSRIPEEKAAAVFAETDEKYHDLPQPIDFGRQTRDPVPAVV
jgi:hypothetical protein